MKVTRNMMATKEDLASMVYNFFGEKSSGRGIINEANY